MISENLKDTVYWKPENSDNRVRVTKHRTLRSKQLNGKSMTSNVNPTRFLLWVDAVGGYLVCTRNELTLGQSIPESHVDIPVLGDLSRKHLKLIRTEEGVLLEPFAPTSINGKPISELTSLRHGDEIQLTGNIRMQFSKSHPLSGTSRLDFLSPHRTHPWSDGILLLAESCLLGPNLRNHVVCRQWSEDIVVFRKKDQLFCKSALPLTIDGKSAKGKCRIDNNSHIVGEDFSMTLEPLPS
jgi:hypothetical protein